MPGVPAPVFTPGPFLTFGIGQQVQPRIGLNYQLRKDTTDKVYVNWGRYSGLDQKQRRAQHGLSPPLSGAGGLRRAHWRAPGSTHRAGTASKAIVPEVRPPYMDEVAPRLRDAVA